MECENFLEQIELDEEFIDIDKWYWIFGEASHKYLKLEDLEKYNQMSWEAELMLRATQANYPEFCLIPVQSFDYFKSRVNETANLVHKARYLDYLYLTANLKSERYHFAKTAIDIYFELLLLYLNSEQEDRVYFVVERIARITRIFKFRQSETLDNVLEVINGLINKKSYAWVSRIIDIILTTNVGDFGEDRLRLLNSQIGATISAFKETLRQSFNKNTRGEMAQSYHSLRMILETKAGFYKTLKKHDEEWSTSFEIIQSHCDEAEICKSLGYSKAESYGLAAHCLEEAHTYIRHLESRVPSNKLRERLAEVKNNIKRDIIDMHHIAHEASSLIEFSVHIPNEEVERITNFYLDIELKETLMMIGYKILVPIQYIRNELRNRKSIFKFIYPCSTDRLGKVVAAPKTDKEVFEYELARNVLRQIWENNSLVSLIFEQLIQEKDLNTDKFMDILLEGVVFKSMEETMLIRCGVDHYFKGDYVAAIHILCPQVEAVFRHLLHLAGGSITNPPRTASHDTSVQNVKSLEATLKADYLKKVLPDDFLMSVQTFLVDENGLNLRNNVAHGTLLAENYTRSKSEFILQIFLMLAAVQENNGSKIGEF